MNPFDFVAARTLQEAVEAKSRADGDGVILAGGTDLVDQIRSGRKSPGVVIDIKAVPEAQRLEYVEGEGLHIGAGVSCTRTAEYPAVGQLYPSIKESCLLIGATQIQNRATIAGNVCNAAPSADTVPPLLSYEARAVLAGPGGTREVPLEDFFLGPGKTTLQAGELLVEIHVPPPLPHSAGRYLRFIPREEMDIAVAGVASMLALDPASGRCTRARISLAAVAPTPVRATEAEAALEGQAVTESAIKVAADLVPQSANPITDIRGSREYRLELCRVLARRTLERCLADLGV